ncbi:DNA-binding response regulator [Methylomonas lenta]|uniref:DNA-binding response regulator n=1 Tax=Methylomonas lenta TaxID=980561 RepID=A0A177NRX9_9GAMM|nr:response regulator transcription factor [Methylomonas lenta]OAI20838.1 DNA-binding response regulator [Methylomonas lenta]
MNVLLIDDHFCAREGVACLLKQIIPELQVFEADNFDDGLLLARDTPLNLVLLDVQLPGKDGLAGLAELKEAFPDLCVVMFSGLDDRELVFEALRLGAMGFIVKTVSRQAFVEALRDVLSGKVYLPASAVGPQSVLSPVKAVSAEIRPISDPASLGLTPREFEVLGWLVQGKCNKVIARELGIEEQTVRNHLRPIFQKFGVARRAELLVKVFEQGIVFGKPGVGN